MSFVAVFIDDEKDLCETYDLLFAREGLEIKTFTNCFEAVKYLGSHPANICFIDFRMPEKNGPECRKEISSDIPCYLITGELNISNLEGFEGQIKKPLGEKQFLAIACKHGLVL